MDNRYLYRAKRTDNGEWVEGFYCKWVKGKRVITYSEKEVDCIITWISNGGMSRFEVDPSTICKCTGIKDKNEKLIFENDICKRILLPTKRIEVLFRISYVLYKCCLSAIDMDGSNVTFLSDYINNKYEVEVIGNVFDNPELLEVGE